MMKEIEWTNYDKNGWGPGPWQEEKADKVQWTDEATGLPCLAKRNSFGIWCGYVGIGPDHPDFEKGYDEVRDYDVHGGLTYSGHCQEGPEEYTICHVTDPGEPDNVWWLGFDCHHAFDLSPVMEKMAEEHGLPRWSAELEGVQYRTLEY